MRNVFISFRPTLFSLVVFIDGPLECKVPTNDSGIDNCPGFSVQRHEALRVVLNTGGLRGSLDHRTTRRTVVDRQNKHENSLGPYLLVVRE